MEKAAHQIIESHINPSRSYLETIHIHEYKDTGNGMTIDQVEREIEDGEWDDRVPDQLLKEVKETELYKELRIKQNKKDEAEKERKRIEEREKTRGDRQKQYEELKKEFEK